MSLRPVLRSAALLATGAALYAAGGARGQAQQPRRLTLEALTIVDTKGRERATVQVIEDSAAIVMSDATGQERVMISVGDDGLSGITLFKPNSRPAASWVATQKGDRPQIVFHGEGGTRATVGIRAAGPFVDLARDGKSIYHAPPAERDRIKAE